MLTGVVVADGVAPTPTELPDHRSLGIAHPVLPVLVDRANPTRALVLWDEVPPADFRADARRQAAADAPAWAPDRVRSHRPNRRSR